MNLEARCAEYKAYIENYLQEFYKQFRDEPRRNCLMLSSTVCLPAVSDCAPFWPLNFAGCAAQTGPKPRLLPQPLK